MSKSKLVIYLFHCNIHCKRKWGSWASLLSTCDFNRKMNKIQNKQMSRKGKQRGVDIKQEDVLQAVVRKTLIE